MVKVKTSLCLVQQHAIKKCTRVWRYSSTNSSHRSWMKPTNRLHLVLRLGMSGVILLRRQYANTACTEMSLLILFRQEKDAAKSLDIRRY